MTVTGANHAVRPCKTLFSGPCLRGWVLRTSLPPLLVKLRVSMECADSSRQRIAAGAWGQRHGRPAPSFWCRVLSSPPPSSGKQQFLLLHADAAKFRAEHPLCYGVPLLSRGAPTLLAKQKGLITVKPPPTAVATAGWKRGNARRDDEVVELTEAGRACLRSTNRREQSRNTVVWFRQYICGGVNTWRCVANAIVRMAPVLGTKDNLSAERARSAERRNPLPEAFEGDFLFPLVAAAGVPKVKTTGVRVTGVGVPPWL